jgi:hypothetical protein
VKTDPTDTGGLFISRRPGTAPVRYRALPQRGTPARQTIDRGVAALVLLAMVLVCLTFYGPLPVVWLWVGGHVQGQYDNVGFAIVVTFFGLMTSYLIGLVILKRLDHLWILVRRAAGYDQRSGMLVPIFASSAVIATVIFSVWLLIIHGPGSNILPGQPQ